MAYIPGRKQGGINKGIYAPKMPKLDLTTDAKYFTNLVNVNMWLSKHATALYLHNDILWPPCGIGLGQAITLSSCGLFYRLSSLWSPYVIGQTIIFLPCDFYLLLFFSSPNLSGRRLDVYHTSTHGVALVRI